MLTVQRLCVKFDNKPILNHVDFSLNTGEIACLLGASGCGKTTILRCLSGFETPKEGTISLDGRTLFDDNTNIATHERRIGMVFQDYALFPHLTVAKNVGFGLSDLNRAEKDARIDELLALVGLSDCKHRYPHELSGGQQQRVALVRALAPRPKLILLDEPFSNLDIELRTTLSKEVRNLLKSQNVSAILVTHDQSEAFAMADMVGVMAQGIIQQWDRPEMLYHHPKNAKVATFVGEGVLYDITKTRTDGVECSLGFIPAAAKATDTQILIRPHDVTLAPDGCVSVKVIDRDFRGGNWLYTLQNDKGDTLLMQTSMDKSCISHQIGDVIGINIHQGATF
ncbi:iron ABC transporter ATPase [Moraxella ovis]|uniref:Fe(3+) ions import ATP-binding protein FbpC n=1 Tax=Moraxella ovis TaxID=29433 RepID=A0A378PMJ1_9GAMM|nr:ABC transporter ATP-binding protein [Moraxella ovis]ANB91909.1 iron ABC transporter ATPase [Moraxella ovis]STY87636.1 Fe(3+) ions import ATP-binding protein FbpC [Moraxella ovis]